MSEQEWLTDRDSLTNEIEQGFRQRGGWESCRFIIGKLVDEIERLGRCNEELSKSHAEAINSQNSIIDRLRAENECLYACGCTTGGGYMQVNEHGHHVWGQEGATQDARKTDGAGNDLPGRMGRDKGDG